MGAIVEHFHRDVDVAMAEGLPLAIAVVVDVAMNV